MAHRRENWVKHIDFIVIDIVILNVAFVLGYICQFPGHPSPYVQPEWRSIPVVISFFDVAVLLLGNTLEDVLQRGYTKESVSIIRQTVSVELLFTFYLYLIREGETYSRMVVLLTGVFFAILLFCVRVCWKTLLKKLLRTQVHRYVMVGEGDVVKRLSHALKNMDLMRAEVVAVYPATMVIMKDLEKRLENNEVDVVVIVQYNPDVFNEVVYLCEKYGCKVEMVPPFMDSLSANTRVEQIDDVKVLNFRVNPLDSLSNAMIKRVFDLIASIVLIILSSPIMLVAAIGTKLSSPGPILFKQERVGQYRKPFTMLKFRSMRINGTEDTGWTTDGDSRKTKFGSLIRKFSIDELPQFFNVVKGDMSLIGPRPEIPYHVDHFKEEIPLYLTRQQVKPGITGWAQVNGLRGDTDIAERVKHDIWYIENWSLSLDLKIILKTVFGGMINSEITVK